MRDHVFPSYVRAKKIIERPSGDLMCGVLEMCARSW